MYYRKEMTEKARAVIAGEIDIPCPIGWHTLYESNVLCAYACTLLRLPDAGIDADAIGAEDIRIFQYGVEHNIETVTGIMYSHEAAGITDGRYDGVGGSDGVEGGDQQMARLCRSHGCLDGFVVPHLA